MVSVMWQFKYVVLLVRNKDPNTHNLLGPHLLWLGATFIKIYVHYRDYTNTSLPLEKIWYLKL